MANTKRIPATEIVIGHEIAWPDGSSLVVETVTRDGNFIDFTGTRNVFSSFRGVEAHPGGVGSALVGDQVTVIVR
jgi:hypothetical protein